MTKIEGLTHNKSMFSTIVCAMLSAVFAVACFLFWLSHPHLMSYQEQYQLFLFTGDYFTERICEIGGLADYVAEFVVQLYYVPWMGAIAITVVLTLLQCLTARVCAMCSRTRQLNIVYYALSALPSIMIWHSLGDENMLMSYPIALIMMLIWVIATLSVRTESPVAMSLLLLVGFISLYWLAGPVAFIYTVVATAAHTQLRHRWALISCAILASFIIVWCLWTTVAVQYPLQRLLFGLNYYRIPEIYPHSIFAVAAIMMIVMLLPTIRLRGSIAEKSHTGLVIGASVTSAVAVFAVVYIPTAFDDAKGEMMRYDYLVRTQRWDQIIEMAEQNAPKYAFGQQAVNLALAKTGCLTERMFEFPQNGIGSLIAIYERNNTSCLVTAETFYHLGMVNSAFRYNFDLQEAIMNDRKSGRFMKRMAECQIINKNYKIAEKYINKLKHSLFYSDWAKKAEQYLTDEDKIARMPEWSQKRLVRFKREMLYDYPEIEKVLGLLALESEGANMMAWDYFNAALLLKNDLHTMTGMCHYAGELFGTPHLPKHIQEGIAMFWTMGHIDFDGVPFTLSDNVKQRVAALAQTVMRNPNRPDTWEASYPGSYCLYFLRSQVSGERTGIDVQPKATERGD